MGSSREINAAFPRARLARADCAVTAFSCTTSHCAKSMYACSMRGTDPLTCLPCQSLIKAPRFERVVVFAEIKPKSRGPSITYHRLLG
jgi:hypothetical protein